MEETKEELFRNRLLDLSEERISELMIDDEEDDHCQDDAGLQLLDHRPVALVRLLLVVLALHLEN